MPVCAVLANLSPPSITSPPTCLSPTPQACSDQLPLPTPLISYISRCFILVPSSKPRGGVKSCHPAKSAWKNMSSWVLSLPPALWQERISHVGFVDYYLQVTHLGGRFTGAATPAPASSSQKQCIWKCRGQENKIPAT